MIAIDQQLEQEQLKIEGGFVEAGIKRLRHRERSAESHKGRAATKVGWSFILNCFCDLERAIKNEQRDVLQAYKIHADLPLIALESEKLAFICLHVAVNSMGKKEVREGQWPAITELARNIGEQCQREYKKECQREYKKATKKAIKQGHLPDIILSDIILPGITKKLLSRNKNTWNANTRTRHLVAELNQDWKIGNRDLRLGGCLLKLVIEHCTLGGKPVFEKINVGCYVLTLTKSGEEWLSRCQKAIEELSAPVFSPMIVPPSRWKSISGGGYLTDFGIKLVKLQDDHAVEAALEKANLQIVFQSVNALQETPWEINEDIYCAMKKFWKQRCIDNIVFPGAPELKRQKIPEWPKESDSEEDRKRKLTEYFKAYRINIRAIGFCANMRIRLNTCRRFVKFERFYFPYQLDKRGRAYPIPQTVHPQDHDIGRALIQFADGKPLGKKGVKWLAIHLANLYGENKIPFGEREQWVTQHENDIIACAKNPFDPVALEFWSKAKKPWCFLAACYEWSDYNDCKQKGKGTEFRSHLPVSLDGTCNGLQHLSALGRDELGGKTTNLLPNEMPLDIYMEVAKRVNYYIEQDCKDKEKVQKASIWTNNINRALVKYATMNTPYGITLDGIKKDLVKKIEDKDEEAISFSFPYNTHDPWKSAEYLAEVIQKSIADVVIKSSKIKKWLRTLVEELAKRNLGLRWSVPTGFIVLHEYKKVKKTRVKTALGSLVIYSGDEEHQKINLTKQRNAIVANLIQSLDAAHMMMTVNHLHDLGIQHFAMIHDSYGVHASDVDMMNCILRKEFVNLHKDNMLEKFLEEQQKRNPEILLPGPPALGKLKIEDVLQSEYFFA